MATEDDLPVAGTTAENLLIFDSCGAHRTKRAADLASHLANQGWTVVAFAGQDYGVFVDALGGARVHRHTSLDQRDVAEVLATKKEGRVAVVINGLLAPGGKPINRLLRDDDIFVVAVSSVRSVRGDHRYSQVWTRGNAWTRRHPPKGYIDIEAENAPETKSWYTWLIGA